MSRVTCNAISLVLLFSLSAGFVKTSPHEKKEPLLIVEATVLKVGDLPAVSCGVMAVYQLATYRVERVLMGKYSLSEITVDHLACKRDVLAGIAPGDRVIVVINLRQNVLQRWNAEGIRSASDKVEKFYVAERIARATSCCEAKE